MANSVIALRHKYAEDLEEVLQCPICMDNMTGPVPLCQQGHHVCYTCKLKLWCCPYCKSYFNGTRNFLAESLITKFSEIKISLIDPTNDVNKKVLENVVSVATQTDSYPPSDIINDASQLDPKCISSGLAVDKGRYPCRIDNCPQDVAFGRMISHIRFSHGDEFVITETPNSRSHYHTSWPFVYNTKLAFSRAINISKMGLFFVNLYTNDEGDLYGYVIMVNTRLVAQQFHYNLEICSTQNSTSFKGEVMGCRNNTKILHEKCLFINNAFLQYMFKSKKTFTCNLTITRTVDDFESLRIF